MRMRRVEHAESFRLHFRRLTLASLLATAEAVAEEHVRKGRRLRARRAEREVARLRALASSLGLQVPHLDAGRERFAGSDSLRDRIGAYTGAADALWPADEAANADARSGSPVAESTVAAPGTRLSEALLGACWLACAAALVVSLLRAGIYSSVTEALEWALMPLTVACLLAFVHAGEHRASAPAVQRVGTQPTAVRERRSGGDRRSGRPDRRPRPVERRSGRDRRSSPTTGEAG